MPHWSWGLTTAILLAVVIWLNGHHIRVGWLLGAVVQLVNVGFGWLVYGQWTFLFLLIPAGMFMKNWLRHQPVKKRRRDVRMAGKHVSIRIFVDDAPMSSDKIADRIAKAGTVSRVEAAEMLVSEPPSYARHPVDQAIRDHLGDAPYGEYGNAARALLAVLDQHPAYRTGLHPEALWACRTCGEGEVRYPCPTVKAIAEGLRIPV